MRIIMSDIPTFSYIFSKLFLNISFITRLYNVITSSILQNVCLKIRYVCLNFDFRLRLLNVHMSKKFKHCKKNVCPNLLEKSFRPEPNWTYLLEKVLYINYNQNPQTIDWFDSERISCCTDMADVIPIECRRLGIWPCYSKVGLL